jgi:Domain of unknown function (DUF4280)
MNQKLVPSGVKLFCSMGSIFGNLQATPKNIELDGQFVATAFDILPVLNLPASFGACRMSAPPTPCVPVPAPTGWQNVCETGLEIFHAKPLLSCSTLCCVRGGEIKILNY